MNRRIRIPSPTRADANDHESEDGKEVLESYGKTVRESDPSALSDVSSDQDFGHDDEESLSKTPVALCNTTGGEHHELNPDSVCFSSTLEPPAQSGELSWISPRDTGDEALDQLRSDEFPVEDSHLQRDDSIFENAAVVLQNAFRNRRAAGVQSQEKAATEERRAKTKEVVEPERCQSVESDSWLIDRWDLPVRSLSDRDVLEVRTLAHAPPGGPGGMRSLDDARRLLSILLKIPAFVLAFESVPPRARLRVCQVLLATRLVEGNKLLRPTGACKAPETAPAYNEPLDAAFTFDIACIVLRGSAYPELSSDFGSIAQDHVVVQEGTCVSADGKLESRLLERFGCDFQVDWHCIGATEVLRLSYETLHAAMNLEVENSELRDSAGRALLRNNPWERDQKDLWHLKNYLNSCVDCFQEVDEDTMDEVCQSLVLAVVEEGGYLYRTGEVPESFQVILSGAAEVRWPATLAPVQSARYGRSNCARYRLSEQSGPLTHKFADGSEQEIAFDFLNANFIEGPALMQVCEDDTPGEFELLWPQEERYLTHAVAICRCQVLLLNRTVYMRHLLPQRAGEMLRAGASFALHAYAEAVRNLQAVRALHEQGNGEGEDLEENPPADPTFVTSLPPQGGAELDKPIGDFRPTVFFGTGVFESAGFSEMDVMLASLAVDRAQELVEIAVHELLVGEWSFSSDVVPARQLLEQLPRKTRRILCGRVKIWRAAPGELLFKQGEPANSIMFCLEGGVALLHDENSNAGRRPYQQRMPWRQERSAYSPWAGGSSENSSNTWRRTSTGGIWPDGSQSTSPYVSRASGSAYGSSCSAVAGSLPVADTPCEDHLEVPGETAKDCKGAMSNGIDAVENAQHGCPESVDESDEWGEQEEEDIDEEDEEEEDEERVPFGVLRHLPEMAETALFVHGAPRDDDAILWLRNLEITCEELEDDETDTGLGYAVAAGIIDALARHWKCLPICPRGTYPDPSVSRTTVQSSKMVWELFGADIAPPRSVKLREHGTSSILSAEKQCQLMDIGEIVGTLQAGGMLDGGQPGAPGGQNSAPILRSNSVMVAGATSEILVIDESSVQSALETAKRGTPDGRYIAEMMQDKTKNDEPTPKNLCSIDALLRRHDVFASLECRIRRKCARNAKFITIPAENEVLTEGEPCQGFLQVLQGSVSSYISRFDGDDRPELILCAGEGTTFGEDALTGKVTTERQTVITNTDVYVLFLSLQDFEKATSEWVGSKLARKRATTSLRAKMFSPVLDVTNLVEDSGYIAADRSAKCLASLPGRYACDLEKIRSGFPGKLSTACVFNGFSNGLGKHATDPSRKNGGCYCYALYGHLDFEQLGYVLVARRSHPPDQRHKLFNAAKAMNAIVVDEFCSEKERQAAERFARQRWEEYGRVASWGCYWFFQWKKNVEQAVAAHQRLVVCYPRGEVGQGKVTWAELNDPEINQWGSPGLGMSQRAEVAHLLKMKSERGAAYDFDEIEIGELFENKVYPPSRWQLDVELAVVEEILSETAPWFAALTQLERKTLTREASHIRVQAGQELFQKFRGNDPYPFCVMLSGCVGRYVPINTSRVSEANLDCSVVPSISIGRLARTSTQSEFSSICKLRPTLLSDELKERRNELEGLLERQTAWELDAPLDDKLKFFFLQKRIRELEAECPESTDTEGVKSPNMESVKRGTMCEDTESLKRCTQHGRTKSMMSMMARHSHMVSRNSQIVPINSLFMTRNSHFMSRNSQSFYSPTRARPTNKTITMQTDICKVSELETEKDSETESSFGATANDEPDIVTGTEDLPDIDMCELEYVEGESFGSWLGTQAPDQNCCTLRTAVTYKTHTLCDILVLTLDAFKRGSEIAAGECAAEREGLLRKWLPTKVSKEAIKRLVPHFSEEIRPSGSTLVRKGEIAEKVYIIVKGWCRCSEVLPVGRTAVGAVGYHPSPPKPRRLRATNSTMACVAKMPFSGGCPVAKTGAIIEDSVSGPAVVQQVGVLEKGQTIGLHSVLLRDPEPSTVSVASSEALLLAIKPSCLMRLPSEALDALTVMCRTRKEWDETHFARIAKVPDQLAKHMDRVRMELQHAQVPLMLDSPFLRRKGDANLEKLDAICEHHGNDIHPEAEWLFAPHQRGFFNSMCLSPRGNRVGRTSANTARVEGTISPGADRLARTRGEEEEVYSDEANSPSSSTAAMVVQARRRFYKFQHLTFVMKQECLPPLPGNTDVRIGTAPARAQSRTKGGKFNIDLPFPVKRLASAQHGKSATTMCSPPCSRERRRAQY